MKQFDNGQRIHAALDGHAFVERFLRVWAAGVVGVLALALQAPPATVFEQAPALRDLPPLALRGVLLVNPLLLVTLGAFAGALVAHRVALGSRLAGTIGTLVDSAHRPWVLRSALAGLVVAALLILVDVAFAPLLGEAWQADAARSSEARAAVIGVVYGGIAEEIMMRWGVMSVTLFALHRLYQAMRRGDDAVTRVSSALAWIAIVVAALVFAAGHLPALAAMVEPTPWLVLRTLLLNTLAGIAYGWLFWRHGLEAAMVAHASTHVGFFVATLG